MIYRVLILNEVEKKDGILKEVTSLANVFDQGLINFLMSFHDWQCKAGL